MPNPASAWTPVKEAPAGWTPVAEQPAQAQPSHGVSGSWEEPSLWEKLNTGLISPTNVMDALVPLDLITGERASDAVARVGKVNEATDSPTVAALKTGLSGVANDTAGVASSFTSPVALATMGAGVFGKAGKAAQTLAGLGFAGAGANQVVNPEGETQADRLQNQLMGGAMVAGGAGGVANFAKAPVRAVLRPMEKLAAPLEKTVNAPRSAVAPDAYTPKELKAYADANGIPLNAAQATEHSFPRNIQSAGERATIGGSAVRDQVKAAQVAVGDHTEKLMKQMSPNTPDLASAGDAIKQKVSAAVDSQRQAVRNDYAAIDKKANGVQVSLKGVKQLAQGILGDSAFVREKVSSLDNKRASAILKGVADLPDNATFSQVQDLRSALLDESRSPDLAISEKAQAWLKQLDSAVDGAMIQSSQQVPGLEVEFRQANATWKALKDDFTNPRSPLAQILAEPDPSKIPQKLTQKGQIGGSQFNAQLLDKYAIDKGALKRVILSDLLSKDFKLFNNKSLGGYSDEFLKSVFTPQELEQVYKTGAIARSVGINTNPSNTAAVTGAMEDVKRPILSLGPKALAAKATTSGAFNDILLNDKRPGWSKRFKRSSTRGSVVAAAAASGDDRQH